MSINSKAYHINQQILLDGQQKSIIDSIYLHNDPENVHPMLYYRISRDKVPVSIVYEHELLLIVKVHQIVSIF